jgi:hypothetical protein
MSLPSRAAPETFFEWFDRAGRPSLRLAGVLIIIAYGLAIALAAFRAAFSGEPMPDMSGGLAPMLGVLVPNIIDLITRHREVMAGGARSHVPFVPTPGGGLVSEAALQGA